jgi:hypothetical protein
MNIDWSLQTRKKYKLGLTKMSQWTKWPAGNSVFVLLAVDDQLFNTFA